MPFRNNANTRTSQKSPDFFEGESPDAFLSSNKKKHDFCVFTPKSVSGRQRSEVTSPRRKSPSGRPLYRSVSQVGPKASPPFEQGRDTATTLSSFDPIRPTSRAVKDDDLRSVQVLEPRVPPMLRLCRPFSTGYNGRRFGSASGGQHQPSQVSPRGRGRVNKPRKGSPKKKRGSCSLQDIESKYNDITRDGSSSFEDSSFSADQFSALPNLLPSVQMNGCNASKLERPVVYSPVKTPELREQFKRANANRKLGNEAARKISVPDMVLQQPKSPTQAKQSPRRRIKDGSSVVANTASPRSSDQVCRRLQNSNSMAPSRRDRPRPVDRTSSLCHMDDFVRDYEYIVTPELRRTCSREGQSVTGW